MPLYLGGGTLQAKLEMNQPGDMYEQEAERVAETIMRMPEPAPVPVPLSQFAPARTLSRACSCGCSKGEMCEECKKKQKLVQRRVAGSGKPGAVPKIVASVLRSPGRPLDSATRRFFEPRFGRDFSHVRVHTGTEAAESARSINALAYTLGNHVVFGAGQYAPNSRNSQSLIAHELTHVVQQGNGARNTGEIVQRYSWNEFAADAKSVVSDVGDAVKSVGTAVVAGAESAGQAVSSVAETALSWIETEAGKAALAGATALARTVGGTVRVTGTKIFITIPDMELCTPRSIPVLPLPMTSVLIPLWGWAGVFAPVGVGAAAGLRFGVQPSLAVSYGPCKLRNVGLLLDPLTSTYAGTGQLYIAGAVTETATLEGALKAIGVIGLFKPPIALMVGVEGGLRGTLRGIGAGAIQETVRVGYIGGAWALNLDSVLMIGGALELDLDFFANAQLYNFVVCEYVLPLASWVLASTAERYKLPISVTSGGVTVGPVTSKPIPFSSIEVFINRTRPQTRCLSLENIIKELCKRGYLPPVLCDEEPGALKDVTASGICKCVGEDSCGGNKRYQVCFRTQKDCKKAQKDLDNFCNNNEEMKKKCTRPKCYYRHSKPKCPDDCDPGTITPLEVEPTEVTCPPQAVTMTGAKCGKKYGAVGEYCYSGAKNWFFKEKVVNGSPNTCDTSPIDQTTTPFQSKTGCVIDKIFNFNGPPAVRAPCKDVTDQTVFTGPTKAEVEKCQYKNTQIIEVTDSGSTPKSGKVITSSAGVSADCEWP
jgi:hypothetical protein